MIASEAISKRFGPQQALREVSFRVEDGEIVALMGALAWAAYTSIGSGSKAG